MKEQNQTALVATLSATNKGAQFTSITYLAPVAIAAAFAKQGVTAHKVQRWTGLTLGGTYRGKCNTAAQRSGSAEQMHTDKGHLTRLTTFLYEYGGIYRLLAQITDATKCETEYILNGKPATEEEVKQFAVPSAFKKKSSLTANQSAAGITEDNAVQVKEFRLDRIETMRFNGVLYD